MKNGMSIILGIGKKPPKGDAPPPMSGKSEPRLNTPLPVQDGDEPASRVEGGIPPDAVSYHGENERCDGCEYFGGGNCTRLNTQVDAGGHCRLFEASAPESGEAEMAS